MNFPLQDADPASLGLDPAALERASSYIAEQVKAGHYPGAQFAVARRGQLALFRSFGNARAGVPATDRSLFLLYSNTKVPTASAIWHLMEQGKLRFHDRIADYLPGFEKHRKGEITIFQALTHQGGFPSAVIPPEAWADHAVLRQVVCDIQPEWAAGSRLQYHGSSAHWVMAAMIEAITGEDFRDFIRSRIIAPLGLSDELKLGLVGDEHGRAVEMHEPDGAGGMRSRMPESTDAHRAAGIPGGGGYATARAMAAFYQMLVQGGQLGGVRLLSPRTIQYVTQDFTGDRIDLQSGRPMHRGLGPYVRSGSESARGTGSIGHKRTFGHGGAGSSFCWGDPDSGVSMAYLTNGRHPEDWHDTRTEVVSNLVHSAIID